MHSECRITYVAHWMHLQRGQGLWQWCDASLRGRNRGASWEIVAASKDSCNSAWGCWSDLFSTSGIYPARGLQKRKEMCKMYLPCRANIGRLTLYLNSHLQFPWWQDSTVNLKSIQRIRLRPLLCRTWVIMRVQICIWAHCVKNNLWVNLLTFCARALFIPQCLHNHAFVSLFFRYMHNMTLPGRKKDMWQT